MYKLIRSKSTANQCLTSENCLKTQLHLGRKNTVDCSKKKWIFTAFLIHGKHKGIILSCPILWKQCFFEIPQRGEWLKWVFCNLYSLHELKVKCSDKEIPLGSFMESKLFTQINNRQSYKSSYYHVRVMLYSCSSTYFMTILLYRSLPTQNITAAHF